MGMLAVIWMTIFAALIAGAVVGIVYVTKAMLKMEWLHKLLSRPAKGNARTERLIAAMIVALVMVVAGYFIGMINALIAMLHITVFWILTDLIVKIVKKLTGAEFRCRYSGEAVIIFSLIYLTVAWYTAHNVVKTSYVVHTDKKVESMRIAVFADAHMDSNFDAKKFAEYIDEINTCEVDAVLNVGDFVDDDTSYDEMVKACEALGMVKAKYGVFYVEGNHDKGYYASHRGYSMEDVKKELIKNNVTILEDDVVTVDDYNFVGRKDASYKDRMSVGEITKNLDDSKYTIVLDHQPKEYNEEAEAGVDLVVSGHTHGGQLFPFNKMGALTGVDDMSYGIKKEKNTNYVVTSGISDWSIKFRMGCVAEYVIIDIEPEDNN